MAFPSGTYADPAYWDGRYNEHNSATSAEDAPETSAHFDWLCELPQIATWVEKYLPQAGVVLDIGAGNSALAQQLSQCYRRLTVLGLDFSVTVANMMRQCHGEGAQMVVADACRMPFRSGSIDCIFDKGCLDSMLNEYDQVGRSRNALDESFFVVKRLLPLTSP